jgi:hypothetical protein
MRPAPALALVALLGLACEKTVYRSGEGIYCSSSSDEDPYYECLRSNDFVCITTYSLPILNDGGPTGKYVEAYACRLACSADQGCLGGDICCPGKIFGRTYGKTSACVKAANCETLPQPDARPNPVADAQTDSATDGGAGGDAAAPDAPQAAPDAPVGGG